MMRTRLFVLALTVLFVTAGIAQAVTIPVSGNNPQLGITADESTELSFQIDIGMLETLDVTTKGGDFTRIFIPGFHSSRIEGEPELPMMNRLISIPVGAQARIEVANIKTRMVNLSDFGVTNPIMPA